MQRHFIRGYFDGDGTLGYYQRKDSLEYFVEIISTKNFCENLSRIVNKNIKINSLLRLSDPKTNSITTKFYVRGRLQIIEFLNWLYKDAVIFLPRKNKKYLEILALNEK